MNDKIKEYPGEKSVPDLFGKWYIRLTASVILVFGIISGVQWLFEFLQHMLGISRAWTGALKIITSVLIAHAAYIKFINWFELRQCSEFESEYLIKELGLGLIFGFVLISMVILILMSLEVYHIVAINSWTVMFSIIHLQSTVFAGYFEELLFRGILFRITEEKLGTWIALGVQALLFGMLHGINPNASVFSSLAIAFEAGILLGAFYVLKRRLWLPIGVHAAWNFTEGAIYGSPVSGYQMQGLIVSSLNGPEWLTGGAFGLEASVVTLVLCTGVGIGITIYAIKHDKIVSPSFRATRD